MARSLGVGPVRTFFRITVSQARGAILGGCLLVALVILAEYGAFEILGYSTFTTEIFTESQVSFDVSAASALVLVLVVLGLVVVIAEAAARGRVRTVRLGPQAQRMTRRLELGRATVPVTLAFFGLVALALGVPVGSSVYWMFEGGAHSLTGVSLAGATLHTIVYSGSAAALATLMALPVALLAIRHPGRSSRAVGAQHVSCTGHAGHRDRVHLELLRGAIRARFPVSERTVARPRLRHPLLPPGPCRSEGIGQPRAGQPGGSGAIAGSEPPGHPSTGDHPA